jgi:hypothetical protein
MKNVFLSSVFGALLIGTSIFATQWTTSQVCDNEFYSQASQDKFVQQLLYNMLGKNDAGSYLEVGAGDPVIINNTMFFEKKYGWTGVSIDISSSSLDRWTTIRRNPLLIQDATESDYDKILQNFPNVIDYLSLDIDGNYDKVLAKLPLDKYTFKVITIEHDAYRFGNGFMLSERQILESFGYLRVCSNVLVKGRDFEDWWIHPSAFPPSMVFELTSLRLNKQDHREIIKTLRRLNPRWAIKG